MYFFTRIFNYRFTSALIFLFILSFNLNLISRYKSKKIFTLMLNPAGDAKNAGRVLESSFERGLTLQFCQELKKIIESSSHKIRVILTRFPGETLEFLQNANFSNRLNTDLYISLHLYQTKSIRPQVYLYYYLKNPFYFSKNNFNLSFFPYDDSYLINIQKTLNWGEIINNYLLEDKYKLKFDYHNLLGIPFKPLVGVKSPAIAIEIGLKNNNWQNYIEPISESIIKCLNQII